MKWKPLRIELKFFFPAHLIFSCLRHFVTRLKLISFCLHFLIFVPDFFKSYLHQKYFCLAHWTVRKKVEMFFPWKCHLNHIVILAGTPKGSQGLNRPLDFFIFTFWWTLGWIRSKRPSLAGEYQKIIGHYYYAVRATLCFPQNNVLTKKYIFDKMPLMEWINARWISCNGEMEIGIWYFFGFHFLIQLVLLNSHC